MSLVGPRPERPELQKEIEKEVPEFGLRLQARLSTFKYKLSITFQITFSPQLGSFFCPCKFAVVMFRTSAP